MLDFELFEISTDLFLFIVSVLVLTVQLFFCFKIKSAFLRLLPAVLLFTVALTFFCLVFIFDGWDALGFLLLSMWTGILLLVDGLAWAIWAIIKKLKNKQK